MPSFNLLCRIALVIVILGSGVAFGQDDSILVKNIKIWYPGGSETGKIKAELWWYQPEWPYSGPSMDCNADFRWLEVGDIVCDSVQGIPIFTPNPVEYSFVINNSTGHINMDAFAGYDIGSCFLPGQHRHLADMYFTIYAPGRFTTRGGTPYFNCIMPTACQWHGLHFPTANIVADPGDFNGDGSVNISDCVYAVRYIFESFSDPVPCGDANGDCIINVSDVVYLLNYVFAGGPLPEAGCTFWR